MTSRDVTRARTSRAREDVPMTSQNLWSLNLNLVAVTVAMGLSRKLHGRFSSFFAWELIWMRLPYTAKIITIRSISMDLEGFCITMATLFEFFQILFRVNAL